MMTDINNATREVFGNIAPWMRVVFFIMIAGEYRSARVASRVRGLALAEKVDRAL